MANFKNRSQYKRKVLTSNSPEYYFAYYGNYRQQKDVMYRSPGKIAEAMGHIPDTCLRHDRFDTKDFDKSLDKVPT